jgi:hypothetical protein
MKGGCWAASAEIGIVAIHADAEVVEALVGEVEARMAEHAARLALEEREAAPRGR